MGTKLIKFSKENSHIAWRMLVILVIVLAIVSVCLLLQIKRMRTVLSECNKADYMKTAFVKALAREIRTPLHSVSGLAEVIAKDDLYLSKGEKKSIATQIRYNTDLIATLLDEVTFFSTHGEGRELRTDRFSPNLLCQRCIDANFANLKDGVKLSFRRGLSEDFFVTSDARIIELVLSKLVRAACIFTEKGEVRVGCGCDKSNHLLTYYVEDTGAGIPEDRRNHIFNWFEEPENASIDTEFDLSVAQRLAGRLGGYIRVDDRYQKGTRMEFTIPVHF